jgi:hypothetical protein
MFILLVTSVKSKIKDGVEESDKMSVPPNVLESKIKGLPNVAPELKFRLMFNTGKDMLSIWVNG